MSGESDRTSLGEWVVAMRDLHRLARLGKLSADELRRYREEREALVQALLASQRLRAAADAKNRRSLRVARALRVELIVDGARIEAQTLDLGGGGFAVLVDEPPRAGQMAKFILELDRRTSVSGQAKVVSLQRKGKPYRVAFRFEPLSAEDREQIALAVFDAALSSIQPKPT